MARTWVRPDLPRYTWDQAHEKGLATAAGFSAVGIAASTIRRWAAKDIVHPVAKAPGGAFLFAIDEVSVVPDILTRGRRAAPDSECLAQAHAIVHNS